MIGVKELSYTYIGAQKPAVQQVSFDIQAGEIFGFLGPSGAGKSTTQKVLIGLLRDYQGEISVMEQSLNGVTSDYYERIGVSFELPNHYLKLTALENLTYFGSLYSRETIDPAEVLDWVGLGDDGEKFVSQYSKGMKNRLSVARALLHKPDLLFMDEPTAGLDPMNARRIKDLIKAQKDQGRTIFLSTHDMTVADQICDRVAFIIDGKIALIDSPRNLKLQYGSRSIKVEYRHQDHIKGVEFPMDGLGNNKEFLDLIQSDSLETIHSQEATLEDIFIEVTGRSLA